MKKEPLNGKVEYVDDFELRTEEDCHPATITAVYTEDDVKAAVAWLKGQIHDRQKDKPGFDPFLAFVKEKIDEAFHDITKHDVTK